MPEHSAQAQLSAARHKVQVSEPAAVAAVTAQGGRLVANYGSYQLYELDDVPPALASRVDVENRDRYNLVLLNAAQLDTSKAETMALRKAVGQFAGKRLHLVQFAGPIQSAWRDQLLAAGAQIVTYLPENTYLVYGDAAALSRVQTLASTAPHVQWDAPFADDYKIHPRARTVDAQGKPRTIGTDLFAIQLVADETANASTLAVIDAVKKETKSRRRVLNYVNLVVSLANPEAIKTIAAQPEVVSIQPYFVPKKYDERQDQIVAGNLSNGLPTGAGYLSWVASKGFTAAQFAASGFAVDVTDSGLDNGTGRPFHPGLYALGDTNGLSRVIYNRLEGTSNVNSTIKGCDGHGTLNSHIIGGYDDFPGFPYVDNSGYHYGLGVCPYVKIGSSVVFDFDFTYPDFTILQSDAYRDGARVSNNSWGSDVGGDYTIESQEYDALVRDAQPAGSPTPNPGNQEMVIVFANGNAGPGVQTVGSPATGKNVFSIGAGENVQPFGSIDGCGIPDSQANNANDLIFFSSRGPCTDGRHKPDLTAPGTHVSGGVAQSTFPIATGQADVCFDASGVCGLITGMFYPVGQELFTVSSGTSHSTPCVAGACALLRQYFLNTWSNPPSPAMTKAYLMNSARYMTGAYLNDDLWSDNQGMGELNLGMAFDGTIRTLRDQMPADMFSQSGQTRTFTTQISDPSKPVRVTIAWSDAPGNTVGNAYNNNLDLTVTVGGVTYKGNVFNGQYSQTGGNADAQNNVESVFLPAGLSGSISVTITATSINSDGVPNNSTPLDQDFALVMYNIVPPPPVINSLQPASVTVLAGQPASFTVDASGTPPLSYKWFRNGGQIAGATSSTFTIASARTSDAGLYTALVSDQFGSASSNATLTVIATVPLPFALDTLNLTNLAWTTDQVLPWYGQTTIFHAAGTNSAAARSYFIGDGQQSTLSTVVSGPATLSFYWKVSSEPDADIFTFTNTAGNYSATAQISGEVDWTNQVYLLPAGPQTLTWTYSKDAANSEGLDAAFLDQVSIIPGFTLPQILTQPASQGTLASAPVTFTVQSSGTPVLTYQWRFDGTDIPGATSSALTLSNPSSLDSGFYSVRVSNAYGSTNSGSAYLGIIPLVARGDNSVGQLDVSGLATNAISVAAGAWHSMVLRADGTVLAWGENYDGQCNVSNLRNIMAIAAGGYHSLGIQRDGRVVGWGANYSGQATPPPGLSNVTAIAAGIWHSLALRLDGSVVAWGDNSYGQSSVPAGLTNVMAIAASGNHSLALRGDGTIVAWGENTDPSGGFAGESIVPFGLHNAFGVGAGDYHSAAALADGTLVTWGDNSEGQSQVPNGIVGVVGVTGGAGHTIALKADSTVLAWGNDWNGQCDFAAGISNVVAIAAGDSHSLLLEGNPMAPPQLLYPTRNGKQFSAWVQTLHGHNYALEYKSSLSGTTWTTLSVVRGNGARQFMLDTAATTPQRFYRVRQY